MQRIIMLAVLFIMNITVFAQYPPSPNSLDNAKSKDVSTHVLQYKLKFKLNYKQKDYYKMIELFK